MYVIFTRPNLFKLLRVLLNFLLLIVKIFYELFIFKKHRSLKTDV